MRFSTSALCLVAALATAAPALAQPDEGLRTRVRDQIRVSIEQQLASRLALDGPTAARLNAIIDQYDAQIAALQRDSGQTRRQLRQLLASGAPTAQAINQLADRLLDNRSRVEGLEAERARAVRQVLTPLQYGQLILSWPKVNRMVKRQLWQAMAARRGAAPMEPDEQP